MTGHSLLKCFLKESKDLSSLHGHDNFEYKIFHFSVGFLCWCQEDRETHHSPGIGVILRWETSLLWMEQADIWYAAQRELWNPNIHVGAICSKSEYIYFTINLDGSVLNCVLVLCNQENLCSYKYFFIRQLFLDSLKIALASGNWVIIGSGDGLSPAWHQILNYTNTALL